MYCKSSSVCTVCIQSLAKSMSWARSCTFDLMQSLWTENSIIIKMQILYYWLKIKSCCRKVVKTKPENPLKFSLSKTKQNQIKIPTYFSPFSTMKALTPHFSSGSCSTCHQHHLKQICAEASSDPHVDEDSCQNLSLLSVFFFRHSVWKNRYKIRFPDWRLILNFIYNSNSHIVWK